MNNGKESKSQRRRRNRQARNNASQSTTLVLRADPGPVRSYTTSDSNNRQTNQNSFVGPSKKGRNSRRRGASRSSSAGDSYLRTLRDPEGYPGVKIPDIISFPSGTFQTTSDLVLATGVGGDSVALHLIPRIGTSLAAYPITLFGGGSAGSLTTAAPQNWVSRASIAGIYAAFRPVSASIEATFIGPSSADGGQLLGCLLPRGTTPPSTYSAALALPNNYSCPARDGIKVLWRPQDNADMEFQGVEPTVPPPGIYIAASGLPSSVNYIKCRVVVNFEAIVSADTLNIVSSQSSPIDLIGFGRALETVANSPYAWSLARFMAGLGAQYVSNRNQGLLMR